MNAVKSTKTGKHRVHLMDLKHTGGTPVPLCGGGHQARSAQWQETILECDCKRCASILARKQTADYDKYKN